MARITDPRLEEEPDYANVMPYKAIVEGRIKKDKATKEAAIEFARTVWQSIMEQRIADWERLQQGDEASSDAEGDQRHPDRSQSPVEDLRKSPERDSSPPPAARARRAGRAPSSTLDEEDEEPRGRSRQRGPQVIRRRKSRRQRSTSHDRSDKHDSDDEVSPDFRAKVVKGQVAGGDVYYEPDPKALANLAKGKFVPMYYFMDSVCKSAAKRQAALAVDGVTLQVDGKSVNFSGDTSSVPSKSVLRDDELPYDDFHHAQQLLINKMYECNKYSDELLIGLGDMFHHLDRHPIRKELYGDEAVLRYACMVRMEWHSRLKNPTIFDIGEIGEARLKAIHDKIIREQTKEDVKKSYPMRRDAFYGLCDNPCVLFAFHGVHHTM